MKALTFLLFLSTAGLGVWALLEYRSRIQLEEEVAALTKERNALKKTAREKTALIAGVEVREDGPRGLSDLGIPLDGGEEKEKTPEGKVPGQAESPALADMGKMLSDPGMQETLRAKAGAQLELEYRDLFDMLGLDETKRTTALNIMKDRLGSQMALGFKAMDRSLSEAERKAAGEELKLASDAATAKLKELLGGDYGSFERFEKSKPEREQIQDLSSMLKDRGLDLNEATESKLMDALYAERQAFQFDADLTDLSKTTPDRMDAATVDRFLEQNAALQERMQAKAKGILSPEQYEVFLKSQQNQLQMMQMGLQMWQKMSGGPSGAGEKD